MRSRRNEIKVRLSDRELAALDAKVARTRCSRESYIRNVLAGYEIMEAPSADVTELLNQVRRMGNNLNQLCYWAHYQNYINKPELRELSKGIWDCYMAIMRAYTVPDGRRWRRGK